MPSLAEVNAASPITETGQSLLSSYLRASAFYLSFSWAFIGLEAKITEVADDSETKSKTLSSILDKLDALGDGTVGARGGEFGADYSQSRDREQLCLLALSIIYDFAALGIVVVDGVPTMGGQLFAVSSSPRGGEIPATSANFPDLLLP